MALPNPKHGTIQPSALRTKNKEKRRAQYLKLKKARESSKRDERFRRKREEDKNPRLREERLARNIPVTIDKKRVWDEVESDEEQWLGLSVDVQRPSKRRKDEGQNAQSKELGRQGLGNQVRTNGDAEHSEGERDFNGDEVDSMLDEEEEKRSLDDDYEDEDEDEVTNSDDLSRTGERHAPDASSKRAQSPSGSTMSTNLDLTPEILLSKFPSLFTPPEEPKILITTAINGTLHAQASLLTTLFPNSTFIRRSAHRYSHKFSVREIAGFASNRGYTTLLVLEEEQKRPSGLVAVNLPSGPTFHFSISNWVEGAKLPGHGNPTNHHPELILNNFRTPLGLLTAHLFRSMFPHRPELLGRQVVTLHNQRDYIFLRRHRYVFRDKRPTEKSVIGTDGKPVKGVEDIRAGLQELGPRFTLKLRRIDSGIQRASGQEWEWRPRLEKARTRFQL